MDIDYLWIIKDDIRNMRKLNEHQIAYIQMLDESEKTDIIKEFHVSRNMMIEAITAQSICNSRNVSFRAAYSAAENAEDALRDSSPTPPANVRVNMPRTSTL